MAAFVLRKNDDLFVQRNIPKNEIGELPDDEVSCDCINVTKLIKTNFSLNLYWKIIYLLQTFASKFSKNNNKTHMIPICN